MTWMIPFVHSISVVITFAEPFSFTPPSVLMATSAPLTVFALLPSTLNKSRTKAFKLQQGRSIYCELPMWIDNPDEFAKKY